jgi:hydrogenase small subunit
MNTQVLDVAPEHRLESTAEEHDRLPQPQQGAGKLPQGPIKTVHVFWLAGMSCDGCSIAVLGATNPSVESMLAGAVPALPKVLLHHPVLSVEAGHEFVRNFELAWQGKLADPYVVVYEGSIADERIAAKTGGYWVALGVEKVDGRDRPVPTSEWLTRLAPGAAAVIAIGTCATWGGVPAAFGNVTGAMSLMDFLGADYRSAFGLPVINVPGCAPIGDNFMETVAAILLFLQGLGPLPEFDELGRPAWLFKETVHRGCTRAGYYEEGTFAHEYGDKECLVEVGCWGPVVQCNIVERGAINHMGGCMKAGGVCIGCTMPGFPDRFSPFYKTPPGSTLSTTASRSVGLFTRPLRRITQQFLNMEKRWEKSEHIPSGWGYVETPSTTRKVMHYFYDVWRHVGAKGKR